jgi:hypothetical protein
MPVKHKAGIDLSILVNGQGIATITGETDDARANRSGVDFHESSLAPDRSGGRWDVGSLYRTRRRFGCGGNCAVYVR